MKDKLTIICILGPLYLILIFSFFISDKEYSKEERRKLDQFPNISISNILNNTYFSKLNDYLTDQFPFRVNFRELKGIVSLNVLQKKEENNVIEIEDSLYELNTSIDEKSINHFTKIINDTLTKYNQSPNIYYSIIPDKIYYLNDQKIPKLDYQKLIELVKSQFKNYTYISLFDELNKDSYYKTDIHWKQEELKDVVKKIKNEMNLKTTTNDWTKNQISPFYGALKSRIPNNIKEETITFYSNRVIEEAKVYNYEKQKIEKVYQKENINNLDGYDVFLSGASSLLFIENKNASTDKELIVFRDSFASSLIPLLISEYKKITLIDLRYISSDYLKNISEINWSKNIDILILYSIPVINSSYALK